MRQIQKFWCNTLSRHVGLIAAGIFKVFYVLVPHIESFRLTKKLQSFKSSAIHILLNKFEVCVLLICKSAPMNICIWYENKVHHKWYLGSLNQHLLWIPAKDWLLAP